MCISNCITSGGTDVRASHYQWCSLWSSNYTETSRALIIDTFLFAIKNPCQHPVTKKSSTWWFRHSLMIFTLTQWLHWSLPNGDFLYFVNPSMFISCHWSIKKCSTLLPFILLVYLYPYLYNVLLKINCVAIILFYLYWVTNNINHSFWCSYVDFAAPSIHKLSEPLSSVTDFLKTASAVGDWQMLSARPSSQGQTLNPAALLSPALSQGPAQPPPVHKACQATWT